MVARYSMWAVASVLLNVPWLVAGGYVLLVYARATGPVAGEVWLIPLTVWMAGGSLATASGIAALALIHASEGRLRGRWVAILGLALAAIVPTCGVAYAIVDYSL